jgi:succinate dehydrogenase/fumarate reductase-like Fe-S protein
MVTKRQQTINVTVLRFSPVEGKGERYVTYEVPFVPGWSVTNVLNFINENLDGGLSHYVSCRRGICGDCSVRVNGKPKLACMEIVTGDITLEPLSKERVIKDLVCLHKE